MEEYLGVTLSTLLEGRGQLDVASTASQTVVGQANGVQWSSPRHRGATLEAVTCLATVVALLYRLPSSR